MQLICENGIVKVYDDGDFYRTKYIDCTKPDELISKEKWLAYPLALIFKWGFEATDINYLNNLSDMLGKVKKDSNLQS